METQQKKSYEKPKISEIKIDAECALANYCKITGTTGPSNPGSCTPLGDCSAIGS